MTPFYPLTLVRAAETGARPRAKAGAQATEPSNGTRAGAASVLARVLTLRFDQRLEAFDGQPDG